MFARVAQPKHMASDVPRNNVRALPGRRERLDISAWGPYLFPALRVGGNQEAAATQVPKHGATMTLA